MDTITCTSEIDFRILGPLEVTVEGEPVAIAGVRQRALLVLLLLNANEVVSTDRLLDGLWGVDQPGSGATALQVRVFELRRALGTVGERIETRAPGYRLVVGTEELDLHRFERLCVDAEGEEPAVVSARLTQALGLWRGPPLADVAYEDFAQPAIARLVELRLNALENRLDADLALGRHGAVVPELQELTAEHPLRERLYGQLMLALYRSGRQAEALEAFQRFRRRLVDELGIDPGAALRELEQAILRQDPSLDLSAATPPERSILVAPSQRGALGRLLVLAAPLARKPEREIVLLLTVPESGLLPRAAAELEMERKHLAGEGCSARAAAFTSASRGDDAARLARELDVDLVLVDAPAELLDDPELSVLLARAPCDVAVVAGEPQPGPVLVPFTGAEQDWSAVEVGAWLARGFAAPLRLVGPAASSGRDASRLLASASLAVQRALGVVAEPLLVEPGADQLIEAAAGAGIVVTGLTDRWRKEGLGEVRAALAASGLPVALVRRGLRPSGLAPPGSHTRFTWSLRPTSP